jgi:tRNA(fMet)-specific endonuclease VapC
MNNVVIDTDVASYILRGHSRAPAFEDALLGCDVLVSFMTVAELRAGAISGGWGNRRRADLDRFIRECEVIYPDDYMCSLWADVRTESQALGRPISPQDAWVAASALSLDAPLATNNRRDYAHIRQLRLL